MNKKVRIRFFVIFVPLLLLWFAYIMNIIIKDKEHTETSLIMENQVNAANTTILLDQFADEISENFRIVKNSNETTAFINEATENDFYEMQGMLMRVMKGKDALETAIYLDADGRERIVVTDNSVSTAWDQAEAVDMSSSEIFLAAVEMNGQEMYFSPLQLYQSNGEFAASTESIIQVAAPLYNNASEFAGVIILDYNADKFLDLFKINLDQSGTVSSDLYVLNGERHYIAYTDENNDFIFAAPDSDAAIFANDEIWKEIKEQEQGSIYEGGTLYMYADVAAGIRKSFPFFQEEWIVLNQVDMSELVSVGAFLQEAVRITNMIMLLCIFLFSCILAVFWERIRQQDSQLEISKKIADSSNDAVVITDRNTVILYVNEAFEQATGFQEYEVLGLKTGNFKSGKHGKEFYQGMWDSINTQGHWEGMLWDRKKDGLLYPKKLRIIAVTNKRSKGTHHYIGIFSDMSSNKRRSDLYGDIRFRNGEMELPNSEIMMELMEKSLNEDMSYMVINIMIENFNQLFTVLNSKNIDLSDHFIGQIKPWIHESDFVAQTGRNLFTVMINTSVLDYHAEDFAKMLHRRLSKVNKIEGAEIFFKTRMGIAIWPQDTSNPEKLLLNSMVALDWTDKYQDTEIAFFKKDMADSLTRENEIEASLRKAIENSELYMMYQPQIEISTGKLVGMEALVRWNSEEFGMIPPSTFIPIAEQNNLMAEIGKWIIQRTCQDLYQINQVSDPSNALKCAINISAAQLERDDFFDHLMSVIQHYGLMPSQLEIEITESMLLKNQASKTQVLHLIQQAGIQIALDDFGTGYSSLSYLQTLPIDKIKIDRSFIMNYPDKEEGTLIKILVEMAKRLKKTVLTEGVETKEQSEFLHAAGCDYIQGYFYSKPLSLDDFIEYARERME